MTYELAKQLKDAGYPLKYTLGAIAYDQEPPIDLCILPTLSELIEECGKDFISLERLREPDEDGCFWALADNDARAGETPEEAVALLWLALKERNENNKPIQKKTFIK